MADPLSVAASILAVVEAANKIIRASEYCVRTMKDAPRDMKIIISEVTSLKDIIEAISPNDAGAGAMHSTPNLFGKMGPVEACRDCLATLESLLPPEALAFQLSKRTLTRARLAWPLKEPKARKALAEIAQHKATLLLAMARDTWLVEIQS
jgi:hypothetical protein